MISQNMPTRFTPLQQEMLRLYSRNISEGDLVAIRDMIGKYFPGKLRNDVGRAVEKEGYTQEDFDNWLNDTDQ